MDGEEEYEVDEILDSRRRNNQLQYLVHFKGWPDSEQEWIPAKDMGNAPEIVKVFHEQHPDAENMTTKEPTKRRKTLTRRKKRGS